MRITEGKLKKIFFVVDQLEKKILNQLEKRMNMMDVRKLVGCTKIYLTFSSSINILSVSTIQKLFFIMYIFVE